MMEHVMRVLWGCCRIAWTETPSPSCLVGPSRPLAVATNNNNIFYYCFYYLLFCIFMIKINSRS